MGIFIFFPLFKGLLAIIFQACLTQIIGTQGIGLVIVIVIIIHFFIGQIINKAVFKGELFSYLFADQVLIYIFLKKSKLIFPKIVLPFILHISVYRFSIHANLIGDIEYVTFLYRITVSNFDNVRRHIGLDVFIHFLVRYRGIALSDG